MRIDTIRVLAVEDQENWRKVLGNLLQRPRYDLEVAADLKSAEGLIRQGEFDVVIIDPNLDPHRLQDELGFALLELIQREYPYLPRIILTGQSVGAVFSKFSPFEVDEVLIKGQLSPAQLHEAIEEAIARHQVGFPKQHVGKALMHYLDPDQRRTLEGIRAAAARIWARPVQRYFSDHAVSNSDRIIGLLNGLTVGMMTTPRRLSSTEIFVLLAAAYLRNIGIQSLRFADADLDQIRAAHHEQSAEMIYGMFDDPQDGSSITLMFDPGLVESVALVVRGQQHVDLEAPDFEPVSVGPELVRLRLLAALLRFSDELDADSRRVDIEMLKLLQLPHESQLYWWKYHYVSGISITNGYIRLAYRFPRERPDYGDFIIPLVEDEIRAVQASLEDTFRANAVNVALAPSQIRLMRLVEPLPLELEALARETTEVRRARDVNAMQELELREARAILAKLVEQAETYTTLTIPEPLSAEIDAVRKKVERLEVLLHRGLGEDLPNTLPRRQEFFGRRRETEAALNALSLERRGWGLLIDGLGGVGKTALAVNVAYLCRQQGLFDIFLYATAKQSYLDTNGVQSTSDAAPTLGNMMDVLALPLQEYYGDRHGSEEKHTRLLSVFRTLSGMQRRVLLILDGMESLSQEEVKSACEFLRRLPPGFGAIATSRVRTGIDAPVYLRLEGLEWAATRQLIEAEGHRSLVTDAALSSQNEARWRELHDETGGSPLALHWVLGMMRTGDFSLEDILPVIRGESVADSPLYQFIFHEALAELRPDDRHVLRAFSLFIAPAALEALIEVTGLARAALESSLERLAALSLVDPDEGGDGVYSLHPLARRLATEVMSSESAEVALRQRRLYARYWLSQVQRHGLGNAPGILEQSTQLLAETAQDDEQVQMLIRSLVEHGDSEVKAAIAQAILSIYGNWPEHVQRLLDLLWRDESYLVRRSLYDLIIEHEDELPSEIVNQNSQLMSSFIAVEVLRGSVVHGENSSVVVRVKNRSPQPQIGVNVELVETAECIFPSGRTKRIARLDSDNFLDLTFTARAARVNQRIAVSYKVNGTMGLEPIYLVSVQGNPYSYGGATRESFWFFGRSTEVEEILGCVAQPIESKMDVFLCGERRAGKTSMLLHLQRVIQPPYIPVYFTFHDLPHNYVSKEVTLLLLQRARDALSRRTGLSLKLPATQDVTLSDGFQLLLLQAREGGYDYRLVLLVDEADESLELALREGTPTRPSYALHNNLRSALHASAGLRAVIAGTSRFDSYISEFGSPLYNQLRKITLRPLTVDETRALIEEPARGLERNYEQAAEDRIVELSGGHPYYCQAVCYHAYGKAAREARPTIVLDDVEDAKRAVLEELDRSFRSAFWDRMTTQEREFVCAISAGARNLPDISRDSEDKLLKQWFLLSSTPDRPGTVSFQAELFSFWIRQFCRDGS